MFASVFWFSWFWLYVHIENYLNERRNPTKKSYNTKSNIRCLILDWRKTKLASEIDGKCLEIQLTAITIYTKKFVEAHMQNGSRNILERITKDYTKTGAIKSCQLGQFQVETHPSCEGIFGSVNCFLNPTQSKANLQPYWKSTLRPSKWPPTPSPYSLCRFLFHYESKQVQ